MGEALIVSRGSGSGDSSILNGRLQTQVFTKDGLFIVPECKDQMVSVRIFGGGGGGCYGAGGGGGFMNNGILKLSKNEKIQITIGKGGNGDIYSKNANGYISNAYASNGGTSSFGSYLSALGGECGSMYIQNGYEIKKGGNGGAGGGSLGSSNYAFGGTGFQFGGGGGQYGGNGGKWGGGGCSKNATNYYVARGGCLYENSQNRYEITGYSGLAGNGGLYLWARSRDDWDEMYINAQNGTNTFNNLDININDDGLGSGSVDGYFESNNSNFYNSCNSSGGGCGGNGHYSGGGGGYGADGGIGDSSATVVFGGGGGGYGKAGYGGITHSSDYSRFGGAGGGGAYGHGANYNTNASFGGGGFGMYNEYYMNKTVVNGADGICIIQYYV